MKILRKYYGSITVGAALIATFLWLTGVPIFWSITIPVIAILVIVLGPFAMLWWYEKRGE